jgi:hypothetical protein
MSISEKPTGKLVKHPFRPNDRALSVNEMSERTMRRFPKVMARLADHEAAEEAGRHPSTRT